MKNFLKRVQYWDDERNSDNGIIVTLKYGYSFEYKCHEGVRGFDNEKDAINAVKESWVCECEECRSNS
mgnify:CR=1 FL=1